MLRSALIRADYLLAGDVWVLEFRLRLSLLSVSLCLTALVACSGASNTASPTALDPMNNGHLHGPNSLPSPSTSAVATAASSATAAASPTPSPTAVKATPSPSPSPIASPTAAPTASATPAPGISPMAHVMTGDYCCH